MNSIVVGYFRDDKSLYNLYSDMFTQHSERYDLTEKIGGHNFYVTLTMPGTIIITNGYKDPEKPNYVEWSFKGKDLHDRSIKLRALSVVED